MKQRALRWQLFLIWKRFAGCSRFEKQNQNTQLIEKRLLDNRMRYQKLTKEDNQKSKNSVQQSKTRYLKYVVRYLYFKTSRHVDISKKSTAVFNSLHKKLLNIPFKQSENTC